MFNSIQHFNEKGVKNIREIINEFTNDETMDIGDLVMALDKPLQELQRALIRETIEGVDQVYRKAAYRKERYVVVHSDESNSFLSTCGQITYNRTYFQSKETGEYIYLADKACGIKSKMRKSEDVVVKGIEQVVNNSYKISGEQATHTEDIVSKQAIMKEVHELEIPAIIPVVKKKKKQRVLYINADEDHVALQFHKQKGDLKKDEMGRKSNTLEPKLVYIFEGIEKEGPNSKRNRLVNKHFFGGVYSQSENLWEEVVKYIDAVYDEESIEQIYIMGDGASWIKKGIEVLGAKSCFVLDKFHLKQYITRAIAHLGDSIGDARDRINDAISFEDQEDLKAVFEIILSVTESENKIKQVHKTKGYILNHWEAIIIQNDNEDARVGCSAEGHVSHIFSSRLSSRPLGWSEVGADKMSRLRIYMENGGKVYDLIKYKKDKQEKQIQKEIRAAFEKEIRKKQKIYTDVWNHQTVAASTGQVNGLYCLTKALRGICG